MAWLWTGVVSCVFACTQMLGLDDYRAAPEAGPAETGSDEAEGTGDGPADVTGEDEGPSQSLGAEPVADAATEASVDATTEGQGPSGSDASDAPAEAFAGDGTIEDAVDAGLPEAADGLTTDAPPDVATDQQPWDAATDAAVDQLASDAPADGAGCPPVCNGGCGNGGNVCTILVTQPSTAPVVCPFGLGCQVQCLGTQVCIQTIVCPFGQPCTIVCNGGQACNGNVISASGATPFCVDCSKSMGGTNPSGCNAVTCSGTCSIHCQGPGCNNSCSNCTMVSACP